MGAEALRYAGTKASEGYPPVAKSAEAVIPRLRISTDTSHAFIHGQSPWSSAVADKKRPKNRNRLARAEDKKTSIVLEGETFCFDSKASLFLNLNKTTVAGKSARRRPVVLGENIDATALVNPLAVR